MLDDTPRPYGDLTRRWTHLTTDQRDQQARRLLADACPVPDADHVEDPGLDGGRCYRQLVIAAQAGDEAAWGWLATTHRPTLLRHGRWSMQQDPGEWGALAFDVLVTAVTLADVDLGPWLRRRISSRLRRGMAIAHDRLRRRRDLEWVIDPAQLADHPSAWSTERADTPLVESILEAIDDFDEPTQHALLELADGGTIRDVAHAHGLAYKTLVKRVRRARQKLRPRFVGYVRTATP